MTGGLPSRQTGPAPESCRAVLTSSDEPAGFAVETFRSVARRARFEPRIRVYASFAWVRSALQTGEVDVIPSIGQVEGRDFLFTVPVDAFPLAYFVRASVRERYGRTGRETCAADHSAEPLRPAGLIRSAHR